MLARTRSLWDRQNRVLYPGSWVDVAASFVWPWVTHVDSDGQAGQFFADPDGVDELIADHRNEDEPATWEFLHRDYTEPLPLEDESFDLLISLYAGFVSEHCTRFLRPGGHLLVNSSHGDAAMASIDERYELAAAVTARSGRYSVSRASLDHSLVPKRNVEITVESLHASGRGVAYTRSPFAYLFERV